MKPDERSPTDSNERKPKRFRRTRKVFTFLFFLFACYLMVLAIGLIPVNRDFQEAADGIEIFVTSNPVHSDLIVPIATDTINWRNEFDDQHFENFSDEVSYVAFGWGDRGFYIETPTWSDMKISTAANALFFPSETVMHVAYSYKPLENGNTRSVRISPQQYERLVEYITASFELDDAGQRKWIPDSAYGSYDAFFVGTGSYSCFRTCNCWTGDGLKATGIKTGWYTPMPKTVFWHLD